MGLLSKGLARFKQLLKTDVRDLIKSDGRLVDEALLDEMFAILIKTDMGVQSAQKIVDRVRTDMRGRKVQLEEVAATWKDELRVLLAQEEQPIRFVEGGPTVIMVCGVNGSGKTTSIAKLAYQFKSEGKKFVLSAGDTFRGPERHQPGDQVYRGG